MPAGNPKITSARQVRITVWDAPTRFFHWSLVVLIPFSYASVQLDWMQLHMLSGFTILTLLLFRLAWGIAGSKTARFSSFLKPPDRVAIHLWDLLRGTAGREIGHNPAGGVMVVVMLLLLAVQALSGLGANDDLLTEGPLAKHIGKHWSDQLTIIHDSNFNLILAAVALHVLAIGFYAARARLNLVDPMLRGWALFDAPATQPSLARTTRAGVILLVCAAVVLAISQL